MSDFLSCGFVSPAIILAWATVFPLLAEARYPDGFDGHYDDLNCTEDDCDCLEPDNNRFTVVSPSGCPNTSNEVVFVGRYDQVQRYYEEKRQTDGLPIVPPTTLKVEKFMRYTPHDMNDVIATIGGRVVTAYQVAVNAVLSGCSADLLPICVAMVKAMDDETYLSEIADGRRVPLAFVNGPVGRQVGVDNSQGMTIEEVNACLGRFIEFALINLAGLTHDRGSAFGVLRPLVLAEDDQCCLAAGWRPYHVQRGYGLNDSTVTMTSFVMWGNNLTPATDWPEEIMKLVAWDITEKNLGGLGAADGATPAETQRTLLVTPPVALALSDLYKSKESLEGDLVQNARRPMWMRAFVRYFSDAGGKSFEGVYDGLVASADEDAKVTVAPAWMNGFIKPKIMTEAALRAGGMNIFVTGDASRNKTQVMPGGASVTVELELPDAWDGLLAELQHKPLSDFLLQERGDAVTAPIRVPSVLTDGTYRILDPENGLKFLVREGRLYYDSTTAKLHYYPVGGSQAAEVAMDADANAAFISFIENLGYNSSFSVSSGEAKDAVIRFPSNARKSANNTVALTRDAFAGNLTLHANNKENSNPAGGVAVGGSTVILSASIGMFFVNLDGDLIAGDSSDPRFLSLAGSIVTVDASVPAGSKAIVGAANDGGLYRTLTFEAKANGTCEITYRNPGSLSLQTVLCTGGTVEEVAGTFVIRPKGGVDAVALADLPDDAELAVEADGKPISGAAFVGFGEDAGDGVFSLALKPPVFAGGGQDEPVAVGKAGFSVRVETYENLVYGLWRASDPDGAYMPVDDGHARAMGTGKPVILTDSSDNRPKDKAFYRVSVLMQPEKIKGAN